MPSQNDRGGNYLKFDFCQRKPQTRRQADGESREQRVLRKRGEGVQFLCTVSEEVTVTSSSKFIAGLQYTLGVKI